MSVLDKRRQEIKQQDGAEDRNVEQDGGVENTAAVQTEQDEGLTIFRYCSVHPSKHDFCFPGITYDSFFY